MSCEAMSSLRRFLCPTDEQEPIGVEEFLAAGMLGWTFGWLWLVMAGLSAHV